MKAYPIVNRKAFVEALARVKAFIPLNEWQGGTQGKMGKLFFASSTLSFQQRLGLVTFLAGNGVADQDIWTLIIHRLRDDTARKHVQGILKTVQDGSHDHDWYVFNVHRQHKTYLSGATKEDEYYARHATLTQWDDLCRRHYNKHGTYPTLCMQNAFFADPVGYLLKG